MLMNSSKTAFVTTTAIARDPRCRNPRHRRKHNHRQRHNCRLYFDDLLIQRFFAIFRDAPPLSEDAKKKRKMLSELRIYNHFFRDKNSKHVQNFIINI